MATFKRSAALRLHTHLAFRNAALVLHTAHPETSSDDGSAEGIMVASAAATGNSSKTADWLHGPIDYNRQQDQHRADLTLSLAAIRYNAQTISGANRHP